MIGLRKSSERGHAQHGWLESRHTFSFADYYDPSWMHFRALRVINEDFVAPKTGFPPHSHQDMEILTYVLEGEVEHRDSMGNAGVVRAGEIQRMTAGSGVTHSESNPSRTKPLHFLQIWIFPNRKNLEPGYEQKEFAGQIQGALHRVASPDGGNGSLRINQDARLYATRLEAGASVTHTLAPGRHGWVQVARGRLRLNGQDLAQGDGAAVSDETTLTIEALAPAEALLFDLA